MPADTYLAHISDEGREQTVLAHLQGTADFAAHFAAAFGAADQGRLAGLAHDLGKYSKEFQHRLLQNGPKVDHASAGAWYCCAKKQFPAAMAISGHHGGMLDFGTPSDTEGTFLARMHKARKGMIPDSAAWQKEVSLPELPPWKPSNGLDDMFFTRMLYSCLVDADYLDTEAFMRGKERAPLEADWTLLWERLQAYIHPWFPPKGELNRQWCGILERCMQQGEIQEQGLYSLTVPTGGGKTVASLAFAIAHAKKHKCSRVIYVIPYTSIIEQTAEVFRKILGDEHVLEHHSGICAEPNEEDAATYRQMQATENWDMPMVVTTAVQFFESLFAASPARCRKLHSIANSVVIFDEAQMLPLPYLRPCVMAISQLVKRYGVTAVLCTATQPALKPLFTEFLKQPMTELCPPDTCRWEVFRRVNFCRAGLCSWEEMAERMTETSQVLCIVNSRKSARKLYELLPEEGRFHLSTLMTPEHRRAVLAIIRKRLKDGLVCRVVSTSLIEAGVDVDFPAVFREEAGLDSILQAAGRCNREGMRSAEESVVTIFQSEDVPPQQFRCAIDVCRWILDQTDDLVAQETIHAYFHEYLEVRGKTAQDQKRILPLMEKEPFPFQKVAKEFHLIENDTKTVYIPWDSDAEDLTNRLLAGEMDRYLLRKLAPYGVNVYPQHFAALEQAGVIQIVGADAAVLMDKKAYCAETGLTLEQETGVGLFI